MNGQTEARKRGRPAKATTAGSSIYEKHVYRTPPKRIEEAPFTLILPCGLISACKERARINGMSERAYAAAILETVFRLGLHDSIEDQFSQDQIRRMRQGPCDE